MKQARRRNRGIPWGVHRHKIQRRLSDSSVTLIEKFISLQSLTRIHGLAKLCWVYLVTSCSKLCLIPLKPSETKRVHFETILFWGQVAHYTIVIAVLALLVHKIIVTLDVMLNEDISIRTYTCICYVLLFFLVASTCCGSTIKSREIQGLINSWDPILQQLEQMTGKRSSLFNATSLCMKITALFCLFHVIAFAGSFVSFAFDSLPVCLYPTFQDIGIIPENNLPIMFWQIALYPLELTTVLLPMIATAFNFTVLAIGLEVLRVYNSEMRYFFTVYFWLNAMALTLSFLQ